MSLALDVLLVVLLAASIGYAAVLNRKLSNLRQHKEDLEKLAATFAESTSSAEESIQRLKGTTTQLQNGIDKAEGLRDDLTFLIDRGTSTADRLEGAVRGARHMEDGSAAPAGGHPERKVGIETVADVARGHEFADRMSDEMTGENVGDNPDSIGTDDGINDDVSRAQAERDLIEALRQVR